MPPPTALQNIRDAQAFTGTLTKRTSDMVRLSYDKNLVHKARPCSVSHRSLADGIDKVFHVPCAVALSNDKQGNLVYCHCERALPGLQARLAGERLTTMGQQVRLAATCSDQI